MAIVDYGVLVFKNGHLISKSDQSWHSMKETAGWSDKDDDYITYMDYFSNKPLNLDGEYMAYIGDRDCTVCFYKNEIKVCEKTNSDNWYFCENEFFNTGYFRWKTWEYSVLNSKQKSIIKVYNRKWPGHYVCKWKYKGDKYKVYFGLGIDYDTYKKYHIVNCYATPAHLLREKKQDIEDWVKQKVRDYQW